MHLKKGVDETKDQSYVLSGLSQEQLSRTLLPLGEYRKSQIRAIAREKGLPVADKHDSQDLCFVGKEGYRDFLKRHAPQAFEEGRFVDSSGKQVGIHGGLANFTIGQRKGVGAGNREPVYVLKKDAAKNEVIIGSRSELGTSQFTIRDLNLSPVGIRSDREYWVKNRYKATPARCSSIQISKEKADVNLEKPVMDITPGQIAVFYDDDEVVASGIIQ